MMPLIERYPIYAANPVVTGAGFKDLPLLEVPSFRKHLIMVAVQDRSKSSRVMYISKNKSFFQSQLPTSIM